jgi:hypothetical protein
MVWKSCLRARERAARQEERLAIVSQKMITFVLPFTASDGLETAWRPFPCEGM